MQDLQRYRLFWANNLTAVAGPFHGEPAGSDPDFGMDGQ